VKPASSTRACFRIGSRSVVLVLENPSRFEDEDENEDEEETKGMVRA
jgi:hypothetical protein